MAWTFEFDRAKSETNKAKHGIDFTQAQRLWDDSEHLEIPARSTGEPRWVVIGRIDGRCGPRSSRGDGDSSASSRCGQHDRRRRRSMKAQDLDRKFDADEEDIISDLDVRAARRPGRDVQRVNVDFPIWMVESLDAEATRLGITRQAIIKTWIAERLDRRVS